MKQVLTVTRIVFVAGVVLFAAASAFAQTAPSLELVTPRRGEDVLYGSDLVIAVSVYDPDGDVDITSAELEVDGRDVTEDANISAFLLAYPFDDITDPGRHTFTFTIEDRAGNTSELTGFFNVLPEPSMKRKITMNGSLKVGGEYDSQGDPEAVGNAHLNMYGNLTDTMDYALDVEVTNEKLTSGQRASTYRLDLNWLWGSLVVGDTTPDFSDYTLNGKQLLGAHFAPQFGILGLDLVWGQSLRSVDDPETFEQWVYAGKMTLGDADNFQWGLQFVKAKDDKDSLSSPTITPQDNVVLGTTFLFNLLQDKVTIEVEANESLLNTDISAGASDFPDNTLPFDPGNWEWLFVINEHLVPYQPGLANLGAKAGIQVGPWYDNTFNLEFVYVGPSYYSLANTGFINDRMGFKVWDSLWLLDRKVLINAAFQSYRDNLEDTLADTTKTAGYSASVYTYPTPEWSVNGGFDVFTTNDSNTVDTVNTTITGGATYTTPLWATTSSLYFNGTASLFKDKAGTSDDTQDFTTRLGALSYWSTLPLDTRLVVGYDFGDSSGLPSMYLEGRAGYRFLPQETLYVYAGTVYETGPELLELTAGTEWDIRYDMLLESELQYLTAGSGDDSLYISAFVTKEF
jgi:hypothetical protein